MNSHILIYRELWPPRYSPSGVEAALSSSSTYFTLIDITCNVLQAVLDAVIHDILQAHVPHGIRHHVLLCEVVGSSTIVVLNWSQIKVAICIY